MTDEQVFGQGLGLNQQWPSSHRDIAFTRPKGINCVMFHQLINLLGVPNVSDLLSLHLETEHNMNVKMEISFWVIQ